MSQIRAFEGLIPTVDPEAWLDPLSLVIGDVQIGARSSVWPGSVVRGDINHIRIGADTNIQDGCILHISHDGPFMPGGSPLLIGDRVTVKNNALIWDGVTGVMLGAGALVPPGKVLRSGFLYTGTPARQARPLSDREHEYFRYSADYYVRLAQRHRNQHDADAAARNKGC